MNQKALEVKDLKKFFKVYKNFSPQIVRAVDGISFEVKKGEIFGFLGPNGAGKTTTIRCLMNFIKPDSGKIKILGLDAQINYVELKNKIGYLSGESRFYDDWTGKDHIKFAEKIRGKSKNVNQLIKELNFNPNIKFKYLSSGNKRKLGLILALMFDPELLIMDEPTLALDPILQNKIYEILKNMKERGKTIFLSSHNLAEVEKICDRVAIIREGKLVAVEKVSALESKSVKKIEVIFKEKPDIKKIKNKNIVKIEEIPNGFIFTVNGDIVSILKEILKFKVKDIEIVRAGLEEVFLNFYKNK